MKRLTVIVTCAALLGAACAASAAPRDAHLTGLLRLCGGPAPGRCYTENGTVEVLDAQHRVVASQHTQGGRFSFLLAPGSYTLTTRMSDLRAQRPVTLEAHQTLHANLIIAVP
ncbi:MAG: hypothetical protein ABSG64_08010 [Solirubrobacteraceae bacterium]|jgi:hypothetical protein